MIALLSYVCELSSKLIRLRQCIIVYYVFDHVVCNSLSFACSGAFYSYCLYSNSYAKSNQDIFIMSYQDVFLHFVGLKLNFRKGQRILDEFLAVNRLFELDRIYQSIT